MELLWKCAVIAVSASLLGLTLRRSGEEHGLLLGLAASALILLAALQGLTGVEAVFGSLWERSGLAPALTLPVLKSLGLALLGKLASGVCRDSGQTAAAYSVELAAVCAILCVSVPLLRSLAEVVFSFT